MKSAFVFAALCAALGGCGQKDNVTPHSQPGPAQAPPLAGEPQPAPGRPVHPGNAPVTPGGAVEPGDGKASR